MTGRIKVIHKDLDAQALYDENLTLKLEIERLQEINSGTFIYNELETKEHENDEIAELKKNSHHILLDFEDKNMRLIPTNELKIELTRGIHLKQDYESKLNLSGKDITKKMILDTIQFRQSMKELLTLNNEHKIFRDMFIKHKYTQNGNDESIDLSNINPMDLLTVCKAMNDKIQRVEQELDEQYNFQTTLNSNIKNIYGSVSSLDESLSFVESLSSDNDEYVLNEKDIKLIVERDVQNQQKIDMKQLIIEKSGTHEHEPVNGIQSDKSLDDTENIESVDITNAGCSIFDIFKCIS